MDLPVPAHVKLQALLFDLDGVLVDSTPLHTAAYERAFAEAQLVLPDVARALIVQGAARREVLRVALPDAAPELVERIAQAKQAHAEQAVARGELHEVPGARALVKAARALGLKLGVASNSSSVEVFLGALGVRDDFDAVVGGHEVRELKPHPALYLELCARLRVAPSECLALEDSDAGVRSAAAAKLPVLRVGALEDETKLALGAFRTLAEIEAWLRRAMAAREARA